MSVVLRPPAAGPLSQTLDGLTAEAAGLAGTGGHWQTGQAGSAHLTVRALEFYRPSVDPDEPVIKRYLSAMERATTVGPARIEVTGLTLTPGTVMASAVALDDQADLFMDQLKEELGPDAWHELDYGRRDIWYLNLLHFTTDIPSPEPLISWVEAHRSVSLGEATIRTAELVRFVNAPAGPRPLMRPQLIASTPLGS